MPFIVTGVFPLVLHCSVFYGLCERTHFAHQHTPRFLVSCMCLLGAIPAPAYPLVMLTPTLFRSKLICFPWPKQAALLGWVPSRWLTPACCCIPAWHGRTQVSVPHQHGHAAHDLLLPLLFAFGECSRRFSPSELSAGPASSFSLVETSSPKRCVDICRWMLFDCSCSFAGICLAGVWAFILPSKRSCFPFSTSPSRSLKVL